MRGNARRAIFLSSRLGRRILLLFVGCALLPVLMLAVTSYRRVVDQLESQNFLYLQQGAKNTGMFIFLRLIDLEADLREVGGAALERGAGAVLPPSFRGVGAVGADGELSLLGGEIDFVADWSALRRELELQPKTLLLTGPGARVLLVARGEDAAPGDPVLVTELAPEWLVSTNGETFKPPQADMHLLDSRGRVLAATLMGPPPALPASAASDGASMRRFEWQDSGGVYLASGWQLFLASHFEAEAWTLVISRSRHAALAPLRDFTRAFPVIILISIFAVFLLSHVQIRRTLEPLQALQEGTRRIAAGDFGASLALSSHDEFDDLAGAFNEMAGRLGQQFATLEGMAAIDRAVLSGQPTSTVLGQLVAVLESILGANAAHVILRGDPQELDFEVHERDAATGEVVTRLIRLENCDLSRLGGLAASLQLEAEEDAPAIVKAVAHRADGVRLLLPLRSREQLEGLLLIEYPRAQTPAELQHAEEVADRLAVALTSARLTEDLRQLNWGILRSLANAVDAKSPWTAGHSSRVTAMTVAIGRAIGLSQSALVDLERGGLLHDVGKLGIPTEILEKQGKLTEEEFRRIQQHTLIGERILAPLPAYSQIVDIVKYHHEHWDGRGYPEGLKGEAIPLGARILAVADTYDALHFDRPYRKGWAHEEVVAYIGERAGRQFDPGVVLAFQSIAETLKSIVGPGGAPSPELEETRS